MFEKIERIERMFVIPNTTLLEEIEDTLDYWNQYILKQWDTFNNFLERIQNYFEIN